MVTKRRVGCTPSRSWSTRGSLCPRVVFACFPTPRVVPHMGPLFAPAVSRPSSSLLSASSRRRPLESGVGTWRCRCRGWSWSWPCRGRGRYRGGVGRRGGGQHGGFDVVVVDLAWSAWGMVVDVVVIDVARSTRRGCRRVVDVAWSWLRSTRHARWWRSSSSARHARRSSSSTEVVVVEAMWWRSSSSARHACRDREQRLSGSCFADQTHELEVVVEVAVVVVVVDTTWGGCRRRRRDVGGVGSMTMSSTWSSSSRRGGRRRDVGGVVDVGVVDVAWA